MGFKKAVKHESKLRMAIAGPSGSGKTWTALTLATTLACGGSIAVIDTEHGSASKYADQFEFDTQELMNFNPTNYIAAIKEAEQAGYAVLIIDSLSHAWTGSGGLMEQKDIIAKQKYNGNTFSAWNDATKIQNMLVNTMLASKMHVIVTVRSKMDYILEKDEKTGKQVPHKVGLAPVQRDDLPYEFDVFSTMEIDNTMIVDKSRCPLLSGQVISKPDGAVAEVLLAWLEGVPAPVEDPVAPAEVDKLKADWAAAYHIPDNQIEARFPKYIVYVLSRVISEPDLKRSHVNQLREAINKEVNKAS
jgi:AAA domain